MLNNRGLSLIELMVALTVGAVILMLARQMLDMTSEAVQVARRTGIEASTRINRGLWLDRIFANTVISSRPQRGFRGMNRVYEGTEADVIHFYAVLPRTDSLNAASIGLQRRGPGRRRLVASVRTPATHQEMTLGTDVTAFGADYLLEPGANAPWVSEWISPVTAPIAVRLRISHANGIVDTIVAPIGRRG